jgi:flagellar biosynthesis regulator FlaF
MYCACCYCTTEQQSSTEEQLQSTVAAHALALAAAQAETQQAREALRAAQHTSTTASTELLQERNRLAGELLL